LGGSLSLNIFKGGITMKNIDYILDRLCEGVSPDVIEQIICLIKADEIRKQIENSAPINTQSTLDKIPKNSQVLYISGNNNRNISLSASATKLAKLPEGRVYINFKIDNTKIILTPTEEITNFIPAQTRLRKNKTLSIYNKNLVQSIKSLFNLPDKKILCPAEWDGTSWIADLGNYVCKE
jgi:hypothetical protein